MHEQSTNNAIRGWLPSGGAAAAAVPARLRANGARIPAFVRNIDTPILFALGALAALLCLRCALAVRLPLAFDEAYYWLWSKHLALGYYEHPADIALAIRAGTSVFGDTQWGVRAFPVFVSVAASLAMWRAGALFLASEKMGAIACLLFNFTLMVSAETLGATPDSLLIAAAALLLWAVAKLERSGDGRLWLAAGAAAGFAISAKYTGFFLCGSLALWVVANARARKWLQTPWPYAGALIAVLFFIPTLYWNATHGFASFAFQFRRIGSSGAGHIAEFVGGQLALASPFILALAGFGLLRNPLYGHQPRTLSFAAAIVWPALLFFAFHALHDRVQGNWPSFAYPALAILAADAFANRDDGLHAGPIERLSLALAFPAALVILGLAYLQAFSGILPLGSRDPIARMTAVGLAPVVEQIDAAAARLGARAIVTTNYSMTGWLAFYERSPIAIVQVADERRFLSSPRANPTLLTGTLLYVTARPDKELSQVRERFSQVRLLARLERSRNGNAIAPIYLYLVAGFHGASVGRVPWPDLRSFHGA